MVAVDSAGEVLVLLRQAVGSAGDDSHRPSPP